MQKIKKHNKIITVLLVLVLLAISLNATTEIKYYSRKKEAKKLAETYVANKYEQEMIFIAGYYNAIKCIHTVDFAPAYNPEIVFSVTISESDTLSIWRDDYYEKYFEYQLQEIFKPVINKFFGESVEVGVGINLPIDEMNTPLTEKTQLNDVKYLLNEKFRLHINLKYYFEKEEQAEIAKNLFSLINDMQDMEWKPASLFVRRYKTVKLESPAVEFFELDLLSPVESVDVILNKMDEYWFVEQSWW